MDQVKIGKFIAECRKAKGLTQAALAEKLGIDLRQVDTVVISHGHYDHGGGILDFARINPDAIIYIRESAFGDYYSSYFAA